MRASRRPRACFKTAAGKTILAVGETAPVSRVRALESAGAEVWRLPLLEGRVCLESLLRRLGEAGALSVLAEGGSALHGSLARGRLADRVAAYIAPILIGGEGLPAVGDAPAQPPLRRPAHTRLDNDPHPAGHTHRRVY